MKQALFKQGLLDLKYLYRPILSPHPKTLPISLRFKKIPAFFHTQLDQFHLKYRYDILNPTLKIETNFFGKKRLS